MNRALQKQLASIAWMIYFALALAAGGLGGAYAAALSDNPQLSQDMAQAIGNLGPYGLFTAVSGFGVVWLTVYGLVQYRLAFEPGDAHRAAAWKAARAWNRATKRGQIA